MFVVHAVPVTFLAILSALASSFCFAMAFVSQQHVAEAVPGDKGRGLRLYLQLARSPLWWAGFVGDIGGFGFQALALSFGSIVLVQPFLVTAMVFALPLAARWNGRRISRRDLSWAIAVVLALGAFTAVGNPSQAGGRGPFSDWMLPGSVLIILVAFALGFARATRGASRATALGIVTGLSYGLVAALTDVVVHLISDEGLASLLTAWELYALIVAMVFGTLIQQSAFHAGSLSASLPATQVLEPLTGILLGVTVLHATLDVSGLAGVIIAAALVVMAIGTITLARSAASDVETRAGAGAGAGAEA